MLEGDENVDVDEILEQNAVHILKEGSAENPDEKRRGFVCFQSPVKRLL